MARTNKEVVLAYFAEVLNGKNVDRMKDLLSEDNVSHSPPYIGAGIKIDNTSGDKVLVIGTMPGSSANGKLLPGDQIMRVSDGKDTWETFEELEGSSWGSGVAGSIYTMQVLRSGKPLEFQLTRGFIEGMTWTRAEVIDGLRYFVTKLCPDLKVTVQRVVAEGDLVCVFSSSAATFTNFNRQAVWDSFDLFRVKDGKIVEYWGVSDELNQQKQLGYRIEPPAV